MDIRGRYIAIAVAVAAVLWFWMFSPWTAGIVNFWLMMSISALTLTTLALCSGNDPGSLLRGGDGPLKPGLPVQLLTGVALAFALWGVFWLGDKISSMLFDFARPEVNAVYAMKDGSSQTLIAILLLFIIGPAEELFWRGFVQRGLAARIEGRGWKFASDHAFLGTVLVYTAIHIPSGNFMLIMAALVAGCIWGFIYRLKPKLLPALIVSHALWDALVFVIIPI